MTMTTTTTTNNNSKHQALDMTKSNHKKNTQPMNCIESDSQNRIRMCSRRKEALNAAEQEKSGNSLVVLATLESKHQGSSTFINLPVPPPPQENTELYILP
jgi:hypothetical protein